MCVCREIRDEFSKISDKTCPMASWLRLFYRPSSGSVNKLIDRWRKIRKFKYTQIEVTCSHMRHKKFQRRRSSARRANRQYSNKKDFNERASLKLTISNEAKRNIELYSCKKHCIKLWLPVSGLKNSNIVNGIAIPGDLTKNRNKDFSVEIIDKIFR